MGKAKRKVGNDGLPQRKVGKGALPQTKFKNNKTIKRVRRIENLKKRKLLTLFDLKELSKNSSLYPKIENYSCYVPIINCPSWEWIIYNICSLERKKKKNTINVKLNNTKIEFTTNKIEIWGKVDISKTLELLQKISINYSKKLFETIQPKKKYLLKTRKLTFTEENSKKIFDFFLSKKLKTDESALDKEVLLTLKIDVLHVKGLKNINNVKNLVDSICNIINGKIKYRSVFYDIENKVSTNILYQLIIPSTFTMELKKLYNNISNIKWFKYLHINDIECSYEPNNFSALIVKFYGLCNHKKTTLEIYDTGYISITGFKENKNFIKIYPEIIYFLYKSINKEHRLFFLDIFKDTSGTVVNSHTTKSLKLYKDRKLGQEFKKTELSLKNMYHKINKTGLLFRKSDLGIHQNRYTKRKDMLKNLDFTNPNSNYYDEMYKLTNNPNNTLSTIKPWFIFTKLKL